MNFIKAIRKAIWPGADNYTLACITVGIAEAFYKEKPQEWIEKSYSLLDERIREPVDLVRKKLISPFG